MPPLRIIFAGSGEFGLPTLKYLLDDGRHEVVQIVSQPDRPAGRGRKLSPTAIAALALERGLPLVRTPNINELALPEADVMVVVAFGQKVAAHIADHPRLGSINLHASLLPRYRGAAPVNWAIIRGETITGNSVIRLATRMDAGPLLGQSRVAIAELETAGELHDRLSRDGVGLMAQVLDQLGRGTAVQTPQDDAQATLAPKLRREDAQIDWSGDAGSVANLVRGVYPWPGCHVRLLAGPQEVARLTLVRACPVDAPAAPPGEILASGAVAAGRGAVHIVELQPEGKRPMSLEAYRNGHPWEPGMRLESIRLS